RELRALSQQLGEWPLLLKLVNGTLRSEIADSDMSMSVALNYVSRKLEKGGVMAFDADDADDPKDPLARERAVRTTLNISLDQLKADEKRYPGATSCFNELAVFPEDVVIPVATLVKFWSGQGLDDFGTQELCRHLYRRSLLVSFDAATHHIRLHDVV